MDNATPIDIKKFTKKGASPSESKFGTALISLSILMVAGSIIFSYSLIVNSSNSFSTNSKAAEKTNQKISLNNPQLLAFYKKIFDNIPDNPDTILATASANGKIITLNSNESYPYNEITFSWLVPKTHEPNTKIVKYYVYFGNNSTEVPFPTPGYETSVSPKSEGVVVTTNSFTAKNLEKNKVYYLYIQSQTDSKSLYYSLGMEKLANFQTLPAKKLFIYKHE